MDKNELKKFRERIGMNQGELAKALSVAGNTVSRWELGEREIPKFLPLALETIERRLSESKTDSTAGSKAKSTVGSKPKPIEKKSTVGSFVHSTVGSSDISASDNENEYNLTVKDVESLLKSNGLSLKPRTIREKAAKGELHGIQGKQDHWFFRHSDVSKYWATRGKE